MFCRAYGSIDIDQLFTDGKPDIKGKGKAVDNPTQAKKEPISPVSRRRGTSEESDVLPPPSQSKSSMAPIKPKHGRLISNQNPLEDFTALIEGEGDIFRKAMQDLGVVIKENIESSFSRQAFPLAIECLKEMRQVALMYEEVDLFNERVF